MALPQGWLGGAPQAGLSTPLTGLPGPPWPLSTQEEGAAQSLAQSGPSQSVQWPLSLCTFLCELQIKLQLT